jgi:exosortase
VRKLGLDVIINGNMVSLPNTDLTIGAQCSGINSIISLFALTVLMSYVLGGPLWGRIALPIMAIPSAMIGNVARVTSLLAVARGWGVDQAFTYYHDYSGIVTFLLSLALMIPISRLLQCREFRYDLL